MTNRKRPTGYVLWEGSSPFNGQSIVAILTVRSVNSKTGDIPQVWILNRDLHPSEAVATGWDDAQCGNCPHRGTLSYVDAQPVLTGRTCYVDIGKAPAAVWRTYQRGGYPPAEGWHRTAMLAAISGRAIRWGAYGDPGMLPADVVRRLNREHNGGHRGYSHQWRHEWAQWTAGVFMASCDTAQDVIDAAAGGWRTFQVVGLGQTGTVGKRCPATVTGSRAQCATCTQCDGRHGHIWVEAHGSGAALITG